MRGRGDAGGVPHAGSAAQHDGGETSGRDQGIPAGQYIQPEYSCTFHAKATFVQNLRTQSFLKTFIGIHWIALAEYSQMSNHLTGLGDFSGFL